jgi:DNA-binding transcriptional regulator GbsR (MarR family)
VARKAAETKRAPTPAARLRWAQDQAVETCGRIAQFWGFTRSMGRTFGLLYVSPQPLTQAEVQRRLGISAGNASMTVAALIRWKVVTRADVAGRREHYQAETDFWKMISGVINERERREIRTAIDTMTRAEAAAREARRGFKGQEGQDAEETERRLARLREICTVGETMLDMLLGQLSLDVGRFRDALRV